MIGSQSFGEWLRLRRKALDLTRQQLARRTACATITIEKIEIGERRPSREVAQALATALCIPDAERAAFIAFARDQQPAGAKGEGVPSLRLIPNNLPADLPALIGRDRDVEAIHQQLIQGNHQLLTLIGPGGVGKTLLASHVATRCAQAPVLPDGRIAFHDGILFVDLATIRDPDLVIAAIARSVAVLNDHKSTVTSEATLSTLQERLRDNVMLIVLDNFEHVLPAACSVQALLAACPRLRALVTSRVALHVPGECVVCVAPLARAAAMALFVARAQAAKPHFKPNDENMADIEVLCRRLDGLPLAIELVAARLKLMTPHALLARLIGDHDQLRLGLIADEAGESSARQHSMRATIAWSYQLLSTKEQIMFCRLGAFVGGCDLKAIENVVTDSRERWDRDRVALATWNTLTSLLEKSLLIQADDEGEDPRFNMPETIREFARERLHQEDGRETQQRHADHFATLVIEAEPGLNGPAPIPWLRRLQREQGNLRAALEWQMQHHPSCALRMCVALGALWHTTGQWREGQRWLETALSQTEGDATARAGALYWLGRITRRMNDRGAALRHSEESVELYRMSGDGYGLARALMALGWARYSNIGCEAATQCFEEGLTLYRSLDDQRGVAQALLDLSHMAREGDADYERAVRYLTESRALFRQLGDDEGLAYVTWGLAQIAALRGEYAHSRELYVEGLCGFKRIGAKGTVAQGYEYLGEASYFLSDFAAAEEEWQAALKLHRELGSTSGVAFTLHHLARLRRMAGQLPEAMDFLVEALGAFRRLGKEDMLCRCVAAIGGIALASGQAKRAATLLSAAQHYFDSVPPFLMPADQVEYDRDIAACRAGLSVEAFAEAWAAGQALTLAQACERALQI